VTYLTRLLLALFASLLFAAGAIARGPVGEIAVAELPQEARATLALIKKGGPYPHKQDDSVFGNRERLLPQAERGTYREYTVKTPGARDRGARRIIAATLANKGSVFYYTDDHYNSFRKIRE
jgi:ribonuclease T1